MQTNTAVCPACGQDYENKENQIFCPNCQKLLPLAHITVTDAGTALLYIVRKQGPEFLKKQKIVLSMLPDIVQYGQDDIRLIRTVYETSEKELSDFITAAARKRRPQESLRHLAGALNQSFIGKNYIETALTFFLRACELDPDTCLGGPDRPLVRRLSHSLDREKLVRCLVRLQNEKGNDLWKNPGTLTAVIADSDPGLRDEAKLLGRAGQTAGTELHDLMACIHNTGYAEGDEKMPAARLQSKLKDAFMDLPDIDFLVGALLESSGLEYTQPLNHPSGQTASSHPQAPARPRKNGSAAATAGISGGGMSSPAGNRTASPAGNRTSAPAGNSGSSSAISGTSVQSAAGTSGRKKKRSLPKLIVTVLLAYFAFIYLIKPVIGHFTAEANKKAALEARTDTDSPESDRSAGSSDGDSSGSADTGSADSGSQTDPYPAPEVSTSGSQSGLYQTGNIASPSQYAEYQGPDTNFYFRYPRVLYDNVSYHFENDGRDIDILFTCESDPSYLAVSIHPTAEGSVPSDLKNSLMSSIQASLTNCEILADRQSLSGVLADTRSTESYTFYLRGNDAAYPSVVVYELVNVGPDSVRRMTLKYPQATGTEDLAFKEYYAQVMYDLCGFGGNTEEYPSWNEFKQDYE